MKALVKLFASIFLICSFLLIVACAGSKETIEPGTTESGTGDGYSEIEQLLGISPAGQSENLQEPEQPSTETTFETGDASATSEDQVSELQAQIQELETQLHQKDREIADLKMQLAMLQEQLNEAQTSKAQAVEFGASTSSMSDAEYQREYQEAFSLFSKRQYRTAIDKFEALIAANPKHSLADNAQYWIGECYYLLGDYRAAIVAFEKVFTFKNSNKNEDAQYKLGLCYYNLKDRERARQEFQTFIDNYKNSKLIRKAEEYLARL